MRTLHDIAVDFGTDKVLSGYIDEYERHFGAWRLKAIALLELGIFKGASLLTWHEYFPAGRIVGLDHNEVTIDNASDRVRTYQGSQDDTVLLDRLAQESAPDGFDIVIDDAAHMGTLARASFWHLFEQHLKPGGIYVIEDWGTGYWRSWSDGSPYRDSPGRLSARLAHVDPQFSAHNYGMVGFIKELVDECGRSDITHASRGVPPHRESRIERLLIRPGQAFISKPFLPCTG